METTIGKAISSTLNQTNTTSTLFDEVELTPKELSAAIFEAKREKYFRMQDEEKKAERMRIMQDCFRPWDTSEMAKKAIAQFTKNEGKAPVMDHDFKVVFDLLCEYFANDPAFEKSGKYSLKKGILLFGPVGSGKTSILKSFSKNKRNCFLPISTNRICREIISHGVGYWNTFIGFVPGHGNTENYFFQPNVAWMVDDLGTEDVINDFGNKLDAMDKILQERYSLAAPFDSMHLTTNLSPEKLESRYGLRFSSRITEMYNLIVYNGKDRRS